MRTAAICLLALASPVLAQTASKIVPAENATEEGNSVSTYPLSYQQVRWQMVIDGAELCQTNSTIVSFEFRADGTTSIGSGYAAKTISPTITMYHSPSTPANMSNSWTTNLGNSRGTVVFTGKTLNIPATNSGYPVPQAFSLTVPLTTPFIYARSRGNLLIDWHEPNAYVLSRWSADAEIYWNSGRPGNTKVWEDSSCQDMAGNQAYISISSSGGTPGTNLDINFTTKPASNYNLDVFVSWLGFSNTNYGPLKLPFDVTGFAGMSNCMLATDIAVLQASTTSPVSWPIPPVNGLVGTSVYTQGLAIDSTKGALVLSYRAYLAEIAPTNGYATGPAQTLYKARYVDLTTNPTGSMSPSYYAPVMRFNGSFN